jgi:ABC-type phosphate transport system auxiliary subunit
MELSKARAIVGQSRANIGRCLRILKGVNKETEPLAYYKACKELRANMTDVKQLHLKYPELKPEKVRQLNLFNPNPRSL